jgi:hypothetical protein
MTKSLNYAIATENAAHTSGVLESGKYPPAPPIRIGVSGKFSRRYLAAAVYPATVNCKELKGSSV